MWQKLKALISFMVQLPAVTVKLTCVFVFAYARSRFSHKAAHIILLLYLLVYWNHCLHYFVINIVYFRSSVYILHSSASYLFCYRIFIEK